MAQGYVIFIQLVMFEFSLLFTIQDVIAQPLRWRYKIKPKSLFRIYANKGQVKETGTIIMGDRSQILRGSV